MARWISKLPHAGSAVTSVHLCTHLGLNSGSADYLSLLAESRLRLDRMKLFTNGINNKDFDKATKRGILTAVDRLAQFFHPDWQSKEFENVKVSSILGNDISDLYDFGDVAKRHRTLLVITDERRENSIKAIDEVIEKIKMDTDLPTWACPILLQGLARIKLTIKYLRFFGHDAAIEAILSLDKQAVAIDNMLPPDGQAKRPSILSVLHVLVLCVELFAGPVTVCNALDGYYKFYMQLTSDHQRQLAPNHQKLLAPPKPSDTSDPSTPKEGLPDSEDPTYV